MSPSQRIDGANAKPGLNSTGSLMTDKPTTYQHTQRAPLCLLIYAVAVLFLVLAWLLRSEPPIPYVCSLVALLLLVVAASFHHLTVADEGDQLAIRFGPLPLFRHRVHYKDILAVQLGRGVHLSLRGGWAWNIWGQNRVVLRLRKGTVRIGTDDAENLAQFIQSRIES